MSLKAHLTASRLLALGIILILAAGVVAWFYFNQGAEIKAMQATAKVQRGDIENLVTATGSLQPRDYVDVGAQVSGQLKVLHVEVGDEVKKGDLLAEIDATVYLAKVDATRAQLRNQNALLRDRQSQLRLAEINQRRQKNLMAEDATTRESLESAEATLQSASAQIAALEAQIEQTSSSLREEEANLEFASIYAPMDGTVVSISARQGQTLNANQSAPTILRLADLSIMTVQSQVSEADVSKLYSGMPVYFTTLGGEGRRWYGELAKIEPTPVVNNNVVLYNALFDVPNNGGVLMTQMTAQVFFIVSQAKDALQVPVSALKFLPPMQRKPESNEAAQSSERPARAMQDAGSEGQSPRARGEGERPTRVAGKVRERKATVQVVNARGEQESREVTVGVSSRVQAQILSGLAEGDTVVLSTPAAGQGASSNRPQGGPGGGLPRMMR